MIRIAALDPVADRVALDATFAAASDYYQLWRGRPASNADVDEFLTACTPGCDPEAPLRLGLREGSDLLAVAEVSFGFPDPKAAYLGYMILAPIARNQGHGRRFLAEVEALARRKGATVLYLGVLEANTRGMAFWRREGFAPTGIIREIDEEGMSHRIHRPRKPL